MSKSRGNALDPVALIEAYGADSLRWALLVDSSPWSAKRFAERIVQEAKSKLVDTLDHAVQFYLTYANWTDLMAHVRKNGRVSTNGCSRVSIRRRKT